MVDRSPIPIPTGFPVAWERPEDAQLYWRKMGGGRIPPMMVDLNRREFDAFARGYALSGRPETPPRILAANGYLYKHTVPADPQAMAAWEGNLPATLADAVARPLAYWQEELLPQVEQLRGALLHVDLTALTMDELRRCFADALKLDELVEMFLQPMMLLRHALVPFQQMHEELFGQELAAAALLEPKESLQRQMEREIGHLAEMTLGDEAAFQQHLEAFLSAHGRRHDGRDLTAPTWSEDPSPVLKRMREGAQQGQSVGSAHPDQLPEHVQQRLATFSPEVQRVYLDLLNRAREANLVREEYEELMQHRVRVHLRETLLEFGRRLTAEGELNSRDEIWWLTPAELLKSTPGLRGTAEARRSDWERFASVEAPGELGSK